MRHVYGDDYVNVTLPVMTVGLRSASTSRWRGATSGSPTVAAPIVEWQRWNDYGIALLRKGGKSKGELRQAEEAFLQVEALGRPDGPLNLARVYLAQGTVRDRAIEALERAANFDPPAPPWSVAWFTGLVNKQNGYLDEAIASFESLIEGRSEEMIAREFDFSEDYRLLNQLGQTYVERSKLERGDERAEAREAFQQRAAKLFTRALELDPESATAHYNLALLYRQLGDKDRSEKHLAFYRTYKPDDNARDRAIVIHRSANPAANHAAEAIVIYDLRRDGAHELGTEDRRRAAAFELIVPSAQGDFARLAGDGAGTPTEAGG